MSEITDERTSKGTGLKSTTTTFFLALSTSPSNRLNKFSIDALVIDGRAIHGACCHACLFAPETSCEKGNRFLDRSTLVGTFAARTAEFFTSI
jgi:hypothetical protein